jgi:hypothetical protein
VAEIWAAVRYAPWYTHRQVRTARYAS